MTTSAENQASGENSVTRQQAGRYLEAVYGPNVWFRAPETFENVLERWIWAVASNVPELAETCMTQIEQMAARR